MDDQLERLMDEFEKQVIDRSILRNAYHNGEKWVDMWDSEGGRPAAYPVESTLITVDESARAARSALRSYLSEDTRRLDWLDDLNNFYIVTPAVNMIGVSKGWTHRVGRPLDSIGERFLDLREAIDSAIRASMKEPK